MDGESQTPGGKPRRSGGHLAGWSLVTESSSVAAFPSWLLAVLQFQRFLPAASCIEPLTTCGWCLTPAPVFPVPLLCWSCFKPAKSILLHWRTWQRPFPWGSDDTEPVFLRQSWLSRSCLVSGLFLLVCLYVCFSRNWRAVINNLSLTLTTKTKAMRAPLVLPYYWGNLFTNRVEVITCWIIFFFRNLRSDYIIPIDCLFSTCFIIRSSLCVFILP